MWGLNSHSILEMTTLLLSHKRGGKKLLDIATRNDAIEIMKIKKYLKLNCNRPNWAKVANTTIGMKIAKKWNIGNKLVHINIFLQNVDMDTRMKEDGLAEFLQSVIKAAKKHNIAFQSLILSADLNRMLPI